MDCIIRTCFMTIFFLLGLQFAALVDRILDWIFEEDLNHSQADTEEPQAPVEVDDFEDLDDLPLAIPHHNRRIDGRHFRDTARQDMADQYPEDRVPQARNNGQRRRSRRDIVDQIEQCIEEEKEFSERQSNKETEKEECAQQHEEYKKALWLWSQS